MPFKIRVFFQLHWLPQEAILCVLSRILLVLHHPSQSHFLHCGSTRYVLELQLFSTLVLPGERVKLYLCSEKDPHCSTKYVWLKPQSRFWQAAQLAAARVLSLEETSPAKEARSPHSVPSALSLFVHSYRGVGVTEYRLTFIPDRCPCPLPRGAGGRSIVPQGTAAGMPG